MKQTSPSADRNMAVIRDQLLKVVPASARDLLEISSGTGQHGAHCAAALPHLRWWPTEFDAERLASIAAYAADAQSAKPDVTATGRCDGWSVGRHCTARARRRHCQHQHDPYRALGCLCGLLRGAARKLSDGGLLVLYGPFRQRDVETAQSNEAFDAWLKNQHPAHGLRFVEDVAEEASRHKLSLSEIIPVPANNLVVVFSSG